MYLRHQNIITTMERLIEATGKWGIFLAERTWSWKVYFAVLFVCIIVTSWVAWASELLFQHAILLFIAINGPIALVDGVTLVVYGIITVIHDVFPSVHKAALHLVKFLSYTAVRALSNDIAQCRKEHNTVALEMVGWIKFFLGKTLCLLNRYFYNTWLYPFIHALTHTLYDGSDEPTNSIYEPDANCRAAMRSGTTADLICLVFGIPYIFEFLFILLLIVCVFVSFAFYRVVRQFVVFVYDTIETIAHKRTKKFK